MVGIRALLIDLDGTLVFRGELLPGAADVLAAARSAGIGVRVLTNTDSRSPTELRDGLLALGLPLQPHDLCTPLVAAAEYFAGAAAPPRLHVVGTPAVRAEFARWLADDAPPQSLTHVVVGDPQDTLEAHSLARAVRALRLGAQLVTLQAGRYAVDADGIRPDTGAFSALLEYAAEVRPIVLGKPEPAFFELALRPLRVAAGPEVLVVGDDLTTDIAGGASIGARTVLVRTGKFAPAALERWSGPAPDHCVGSLLELPPLLVSAG